MQFGVFTVGDATQDPTTGRVPTDAERVKAMMTIALSQAILESSLAQAASRFNSMAVAKKRATELLYDYRLEFHRAKRSESDRRLREVMVSIKKKKARARANG